MTEINQEPTSKEPASSGPGQRLRLARENLNYSLEQASRHLHLDVQTIQCIENDTYPERLPSTYLKGYLRAYAKWLDLPADEIVASFQSLSAQDAVLTGIQSLSSLPSSGVAKHSRQLLVSVVLIVCLLGIGAAAYYLGPHAMDYVKALLPVEPTTVERENKKAPVTLSNSQGELTLDLGPNPEDSASIPMLNSATSVAPNALVLPANLGLEPSGTAKTPPQELEPFPSMAEVLLFNFTGDCWVRVTDVNGEVLAIGTKQQGHRMRVAGLPPLTVVLGNPSAVELSHNGKPKDLTRYPSGNPATITINAPASE